MTREEAIAIIENEKECVNRDCNRDCYNCELVKTDTEILTALDMAIKALEQETILDKIRAEIMDFEEELFHRPNTDYTDYAAVRHCVEIIDKYKPGNEK